MEQYRQACLKSLSIGDSFNQSMDDIVWPASSQGRLTLAYTRRDAAGLAAPVVGGSIQSTHRQSHMVTRAPITTVC